MARTTSPGRGTGLAFLTAGVLILVAAGTMKGMGVGPTSVVLLLGLVVLVLGGLFLSLATRRRGAPGEPPSEDPGRRE